MEKNIFRVGLLHNLQTKLVENEPTVKKKCFSTQFSINTFSNYEDYSRVFMRITQSSNLNDLYKQLV